MQSTYEVVVDPIYIDLIVTLIDFISRSGQFASDMRALYGSSTILYPLATATGVLSCKNQASLIEQGGESRLPTVFHNISAYTLSPREVILIYTQICTIDIGN